MKENSIAVGWAKELEVPQILTLLGLFDYLDAIANKKLMNPFYEDLILDNDYNNGQIIARNLLTSILADFAMDKLCITKPNMDVSPN